MNEGEKRRDNMRIKEAIEIQQEVIKKGSLGDVIKTYSAMLLGIEALKLIRELRLHHEVLPDYRLPGETRE